MLIDDRTLKPLLYTCLEIISCDTTFNCLVCSFLSHLLIIVELHFIITTTVIVVVGVVIAVVVWGGGTFVEKLMLKFQLV